MIALFRKELGELRAMFILAIAALILLFWAHTTRPLALFGGDSLIRYLIEDITIIGSLAAFAAGHSRFGPEYQQGTLEFLDALPTTRSRVFFAKLLTGSLPLLITAVGIGLLKAWTLWLHPLPNSASTLSVALVVMVVTGTLMAAHYTTGLVLSWFGEVGWQAMLVSCFGLLIFTSILPALAQWYPLFSGVLSLEVTDGWTHLPLGPVVLWSVWTVGGGLLAWGLFLGPGDRIARGPWWIKAIAQVLLYAPPVLLILLLVVSSTLMSAIELSNLIQPTFRVETEHFRILAAEANRAEASHIIREAEQVRARVVERFDDEGPERIDLELTGASQHLGGVFVPGKIQLRWDADPQVLAHELSHAWAHHLGAPQGEAHAWRFFEEGLATLNESLVGTPESLAAVPWYGSPESDWFLAPAHFARSEQFNPDDDYAIGRVWAEAIVDQGGPQALTCIIKTAGANPREDQNAIPWWFNLLSSCDLALDTVIVDYEGRLPRGGEPVHDIGWYAGSTFWFHEIETTRTLEGKLAICIVRSNANTARTEYVVQYSFDGDPCSIPRINVRASRFQLAVGYEDNGAYRIGPWRTLSVP